MLKTTSEIFISNLRQLRGAKYPSQAEIAEEVGFSVRGYQKYEQGKSSPTPDILDRFAKSLGCEPWELVHPDPPCLRSNHLKLSDLAREDRVLDILERIDSRLPSETSQIEIERLKGEIEGLRELIDPYRDILDALKKAQNTSPKRVEAVRAALGIRKTKENKGLG